MVRVGMIASTALVIGWAVTACSAGDSAGGGAAGGASPPGITAQEIDSYGLADFPRDFSGVAVDGDHRTVVVYRLAGSGLDGPMRARFPAASLRFVDARHTEVELRALAGRIAADIPSWRQRGITISTVGPEPDGSVVDIGTPDPATARDALDARYGADRVRVQQAAVPRFGTYTGVVPVPPGDHR